MGAVDAVVALAAVAGPAVLVLRDVATVDRPRRERPARERPVPVERVAPVPVIPVPVVEHHDGSMLGSLAATEHDEHTALRRVGALLVLLALTLVTAALVGAGIYRVVSALG